MLRCLLSVRKIGARLTFANEHVCWLDVKRRKVFLRIWKFILIRFDEKQHTRRCTGEWEAAYMALYRGMRSSIQGVVCTASMHREHSASRSHRRIRWAIHWGYKKSRTHAYARVFSPTLALGNSKNEIRQRNRGIRCEKRIWKEAQQTGKRISLRRNCSSGINLIETPWKILGE